MDLVATFFTYAKLVMVFVGRMVGKLLRIGTTQLVDLGQQLVGVSRIDLPSGQQQLLRTGSIDDAVLKDLVGCVSISEEEDKWEAGGRNLLDEIDKPIRKISESSTEDELIELSDGEERAALYPAKRSSSAAKSPFTSRANDVVPLSIMAPRTVRRSLLGLLLALVVAIACMLVLSIQIPSVAAARASSSDFKRFGIGEVFDEDEDEDDDWDFMDDDALLGPSERPGNGNTGIVEESKGFCADSVPQELVDDDYCDCEDGSDEPHTSACSHVLLRPRKTPLGLEFSCKADDKLVPLTFVGDGVCDCCDGSDEKEGVCVDTCGNEWHKTLTTLTERLDVVQRGLALRKRYLAQAVDKVTQLNADFERLTEAYQTGQRAFEDLQRRAQHNPELRGQLEQSYNVLRTVQYVAYVDSRVVDHSTFSDASWKPAFVELVGQCFPYTVDEKQLKGGAPNVIPREYVMVLCPFQNVSQTEPGYPSWTKAERETKGGVTTASINEEEVPRPIGLGIWNQWLAKEEDSPSFARVQNYNHGEPCAGGKERQTRVEYSCGVSNRVISVEEREMCEYEVLFETPAACGTTEEDALQDGIAQVKRLAKELQQGDALIRTSSEPQGHEEL